MAVERIWNAKIANDQWLTLAAVVSKIDLDRAIAAARNGDTTIRQFAQVFDKATTGDLKKDLPPTMANSERPFVPESVWVLFSAYQGILLHSVMVIKMLALGSAEYFKGGDTLKPKMLAALPELKDYIEKYGNSGYYHLLEILERKLLTALRKLLGGEDGDNLALVRSVEIRTAVEALVYGSTDIPASIRKESPPEPE